MVYPRLGGGTVVILFGGTVFEGLSPFVRGNFSWMIFALQFLFTSSLLKNYMLNVGFRFVNGHPFLCGGIPGVAVAGLHIWSPSRLCGGTPNPEPTGGP